MKGSQRRLDVRCGCCVRPVTDPLRPEGGRVNRALVYRGRPTPGVYQRCTDHCNAEQCTQHRWQYEVELPPGPNGRRRRITKGGFLTGKQAADARDEILHQHRAGSLPTNPDPTLAAWLRSWLALRIERADLRDGTIADYRDSIDRYLIPRLGHLNLAEIRGVHITT